MNIAILGAGGVGGYFGGILARAGHSVTLLARGAHLAALRERGLEVRTPEGTFIAAVAATGDPQEIREVELAVVAVKSYSLPEIVPAARLLAERGAVVLPLLNGVEAADRLVDQGVPGDQVLGGLAEISAARIGPGVVERRSPFQRIVAGERTAASRNGRSGSPPRSARPAPRLGPRRTSPWICGASSPSSPPCPPPAGWPVRPLARSARRRWATC